MLKIGIRILYSLPIFLEIKTASLCSNIAHIYTHATLAAYKPLKKITNSSLNVDISVRRVGDEQPQNRTDTIHNLGAARSAH